MVFPSGCLLASARGRLSARWRAIRYERSSVWIVPKIVRGTTPSTRDTPTRQTGGRRREWQVPRHVEHCTVMIRVGRGDWHGTGFRPGEVVSLNEDVFRPMCRCGTMHEVEQADRVPGQFLVRFGGRLFNRYWPLTPTLLPEDTLPMETAVCAPCAPGPCSGQRRHQMNWPSDVVDGSRTHNRSLCGHPLAHGNQGARLQKTRAHSPGPFWRLPFLVLATAHSAAEPPSTAGHDITHALPIFLFSVVFAIGVAAAAPRAARRRQIRQTISTINSTLLGFGVDPKQNINRLVTLARDLLDADNRHLLRRWRVKLPSRWPPKGYLWASRSPRFR